MSRHYRRDEPDCDEQGFVTLLMPQRSYRVRVVHPKPARSRWNPRRGYAKQQAARRTQRRNRARIFCILEKIERDAQLAEVEAALEELAAEGKIQKNPDGTYQRNPPTKAELMVERRNRARNA